MEKTCCFMGHQNIPADKLEKVRRELEREIGAALEDGCRTFITAFVENGDMLFARLVSKRREDCPDIFLEAIIPTPDHAQAYNRDEWELLSKSGGIKVLCEECRKDYALNITRYMVEKSGRAIAVYSEKADDSSLYAIGYARTMERNVRIIEI